METVRKNQPKMIEMKNIVIEIKIVTDSLSRLNKAKERTIELENNQTKR